MTGFVLLFGVFRVGDPVPLIWNAMLSEAIVVMMMGMRCVEALVGTGAGKV